MQHAYHYDGLGRQVHDHVPTLGTSAVGNFRRLSTVYDTIRMTGMSCVFWRGLGHECPSYIRPTRVVYSDVFESGSMDRTSASRSGVQRRIAFRTAISPARLI